MSGTLSQDKKATRRSAAPSLEQEYETLKAVFDGIEDVIYVADPETHELLHANEAFRKAWGEDVIGKKCYRVLQARDEPCPFCTNDRIFGENLGRTHVWEFQNEVTKSWFRCSDKAIRWVDGRMVRFEIAADITEQKQTEQSLLASEERFRATFEQAAVGIAHVSPEGKWLRVNQKLCDIVGYSREELLERTFQDITHPDDLNTDLAYVQQVLSGEIPTYSMEKRYYHKDGSVVWVNLTVSLVRDASGDPEYFISVVEDITERNRTEEDLRLKNIIFESSLAANSACGIDGIIRQANQAFATMWGYESKTEVCGNAVQHFFADQTKAAEVMQALNTQGRWKGEFQARRKDGSTFMARGYATDVRTESGRIIGYQSACIDVTAEREAEQTVSSFLDHTEDLVTIVNTEGRFTYVNQAARKIYGVRPEDLVGRSAFEFILEEDRERTQEAFMGWLERRETSASHENRQVSADGTVRHMLWTITLRYGPDGKPESFWSIARDITERKNREEQAKATRNRLQQFIDNVPAGVFVLDREGTPAFANQSAIELLGKGIAGGPKPDGLAETYSAYIRGTNELYPAKNMPIVRALSGESVFVDDMEIHGPGGVTPLHVKASPVYDLNGNIEYAIAVFVDVTNLRAVQKDLETALAELQRSNQELEQFAYVASHDLQEPLRMVASYTELLAQRYAGNLDEKADKYIAYAVNGAKRMQALINDLLTFSRVGTRGQPPEPTDCNRVVETVMQGLARKIEETETEVIVGDLPEVMADESQLGQVFQNLIANAIKFQGEGSPRIEISGRENGLICEFCVADNGIGIDPEFHERIFVIFQRLHERGKYPGSGIGLAIVKKIVERHGGRVRLDSAAGAGARFTFTMPSVAHSERNGNEREDQDPARRGQSR